MNPPAGDAALSLRGITKRFGALLANDSIDLTLGNGEILALLGENGAGKTTLMNILFGHYRADAGTIQVRGKSLDGHTPADALRAGIGMVHQHFTLADNLSVLDNIMLGSESLWSPRSRRAAAARRLNALIDRVGLRVNLRARVRELGVGQRQRVEILKALYRDTRILILDEPTAVLTPQEVDELFALLRRMTAEGLSVIIISHKLQEVLAISDRIVVLRRGAVVGEAATDSVDRATLAEMIVGRRIERPRREPRAPGDEILRLDTVSVLDRRHAKPLLTDVDLQVAAGQIVGVAGVSGNGQEALAAIVAGTRQPDRGTIRLLGNEITRCDPRQLNHLGVARIPEDRHTEGVIGEMTLWENLLLDDLGAPPCWRAGSLLDRRAARQRAGQLLAAFDVRHDRMEQPTALLSGGNMQKLILARNLSREPLLVLANQPTRGLDEGAIAAVHTMLLEARSRGAGVLLIAEDLDELLRLADDIVVIHDGIVSAPCPSDSLDARTLGLAMTGAEPLRHSA